MGVGKNIKRILAEKEMSIKELHEISGISLNTLYSITKRDSTSINPEILASIAKALNVTNFDLTVDVEQLRSDVRLQEEVQNAFGKSAVDLLNNFDQLNAEGQTKASDYVSDLTKLPKYKKEPQLLQQMTVRMISERKVAPLQRSPSK